MLWNQHTDVIPFQKRISSTLKRQQKLKVDVKELVHKIILFQVICLNPVEVLLNCIINVGLLNQNDLYEIIIKNLSKINQKDLWQHFGSYVA